MHDIDIMDFYGNHTGGDWTPVLEAAVAVAYANRCAPIRFPVGHFSFLTPIKPFTRGIQIVGAGCVGTNTGYGTFLSYGGVSGSDFLVWNGATPYNGGGGRVADVNISRRQGTGGGCAIKLTGTSGETRAGWHVTSDVLIYDGSDVGEFDIGIRIDGGTIEIPASSGIRDVTVRNLSIAGCRQYAVSCDRLMHSRLEFHTTPLQNVGNARFHRCEGMVAFPQVWGTLTVTNCDRISMLGQAGAFVQSANTRSTLLIT